LLRLLGCYLVCFGYSFDLCAQCRFGHGPPLFILAERGRVVGGLSLGGASRDTSFRRRFHIAFCATHHFSTGADADLSVRICGDTCGCTLVRSDGSSFRWGALSPLRSASGQAGFLSNGLLTHISGQRKVANLIHLICSVFNSWNILAFAVILGKRRFVTALFEGHGRSKLDL
jgi:hypothetical protein